MTEQEARQAMHLLKLEGHDTVEVRFSYLDPVNITLVIPYPCNPRGFWTLAQVEKYVQQGATTVNDTGTFEVIDEQRGAYTVYAIRNTKTGSIGAARYQTKRDAQNDIDDQRTHRN